MAHRRGWRNALTFLRSMFPDERFRYDSPPSYMSLWMSDGHTWPGGQVQHDAPPVEVFRDAGVAVARHPADKPKHMLILDNGPNHASHAHMDNLTVHYEALGRPIIVDPGRWVYRTGPDRTWVTQTASHNTIFIEPDDPRDAPLIHTIADPRDPRVGPIEHAIEDGCVRLTTRFRGYMPDETAVVRRTVLFPLSDGPPWLAVVDVVEGSRVQRWTNAWLLPAEAPPIEPPTVTMSDHAATFTVAGRAHRILV